MSINPEATDVSQNDAMGPPTVPIEMAASQIGLRNRARQIPDGLAHLNSGGSDTRQADMSNLRRIACSLVRLDVWALNTIEHSYIARPQLVGEYVYRQFKDLVSSEVEYLAVDDDAYENRFENDIQDCLEDSSDRKILEILCDTRTSTYYAQFIQLRTLMYTSVIAEHSYALNASNLTVTEERDGFRNPQQYFRHLAMESNKNKIRLRSVVTGCRTLQARIKRAAEIGEIPPVALEALKKKLEALQENFREACAELKIKSYVLIDPNIAQWWDPDNEATQDSELNAPHATAATAYPYTGHASATLSFLVPTICLLSCIPAALAWSHTPSQVGAYDDGNFYQLLSSSAMQLLGTGTLVWPTFSSARLLGRPWIWIWILTGASVICTVVSVPLYLNVPTAWSGLLSFCGNVAQALALLQLVHSL